MKKILSLALAAILLCLPCLLASCQTEQVGNESSEAPKGPTHAELFWEALSTLGDYFKPLESTFGMPLFSIVTNEEDGTETEIFAIQKFSAMDVSMIGDQPVRKETVTVMVDGVCNAHGTWFAAGEEIPFKEYSDETLQYVLLPGVQEEPFTAVGGGITVSMSGLEIGGIPDRALADLEAAVKGLFTDDMILIAKSDVVDTYTITMDPDTAKAFDEALDQAMAESGLTDLLGIGDLLNSEGIEVSGTETTVVMVLNVAAGKNYQLKLSTVVNGAETDVTKFNLSVNGAVTALKYSAEQDGAVVNQTDCTFTVAASNMKIDLTSTEGDTTTTAGLMVTADASGKITYKGNVDTSVTVEGMALSVPITVEGTYQEIDAGTVNTMTLTASIAGLMEIAISSSSTFTPGEGLIVKPTPGVDVKKIDMDTLMEQMRGTYPKTVELYESLLELTDPESGLIPRE
ncbi:MAG: hypothetical protein IKT91_07935 [Clostridia bacterium]|nr:hypothetical protein [Clostridia bacterium]